MTQHEDESMQASITFAASDGFQQTFTTEQLAPRFYYPNLFIGMEDGVHTGLYTEKSSDKTIENSYEGITVDYLLGKIAKLKTFLLLEYLPKIYNENIKRIRRQYRT